MQENQPPFVSVLLLFKMTHTQLGFLSYQYNFFKLLHLYVIKPACYHIQREKNMNGRRQGGNRMGYVLCDFVWRPHRESRQEKKDKRHLISLLSALIFFKKNIFIECLKVEKKVWNCTQSGRKTVAKYVTFYLDLIAIIIIIRKKWVDMG